MGLFNRSCYFLLFEISWAGRRTNGGRVVSVVSSVPRLDTMRVFAEASLRAATPSLPVLMVMTVLVPTFSTGSFFFVSQSVEDLGDFLWLTTVVLRLVGDCS